MPGTFDTVANDALIRTGDFLIEDVGAGSSIGVQLAALPGGGFVAILNDASGITGRFYDADGNPVGSDFPIDAGNDADVSGLSCQTETSRFPGRHN